MLAGERVVVTPLSKAIRRRVHFSPPVGRSVVEAGPAPTQRPLDGF